MFIIAGPNGAGKTTLSYTILPDIFHCDEFINADEIAKGISPLNPEKAKLRSGRIMLQRIHELLKSGDSFAFETTLATKTHQSLVKRAQEMNYVVVLLFLTLDSIELAIQRVETRVIEGGHNIPNDIIARRFINGLRYFFDIYVTLVNQWILVDNSTEKFEFIAEGSMNSVFIKNKTKWNHLKEYQNGH